MKRILFCLFLLMSFSTIYATNYNYTVDCITDSSGNIVNSTDEISENDKYSVVQKEFKNISDSSNIFFCIGKLVKKESAIVPLDTSTSYIGYYADIDGDGTVDGVIFADLAFSKKGQWTNSRGVYSYSAKTNLKQYYVSQESYTDSTYGSKAVISPVSGTTGNDRFYVMTLGTVAKGYWYYNAKDNATAIISATGEGDNDFGTGKSKTNTVMTAWKNKKYNQNSNDIWGQIQTQVENGWFVPSKSELSAYSHNVGQIGGDSWSSSLCNSSNAFHAKYEWNTIDVNHVGQYKLPVRLATTY